MKKYECVSVKLGMQAGVILTDHRQIIDEYANKGYRYVGYIPIHMTDEGEIRKIDLIFELDQ